MYHQPDQMTNEGMKSETCFLCVIRYLVTPIYQACDLTIQGGEAIRYS
jgi:hypothetical protein